MFCPNCATSNNNDVKYCRSCGANLSLIPQALSGKLPDKKPDWGQEWKRPRDRHRREASLQNGIRLSIAGLGFLLASVILMFVIRGMWWGVFLLIPGFAMLGSGISQIVTHGQQKDSTTTTSDLSGSQAAIPAPPHAIGTEFTSAPPSVTETTTRHLDQSTERQSG